MTLRDLLIKLEAIPVEGMDQVYVNLLSTSLTNYIRRRSRANARSLVLSAIVTLKSVNNDRIKKLCVELIDATADYLDNSPPPRELYPIICQEAAKFLPYSECLKRLEATT